MYLVTDQQAGGIQRMSVAEARAGGFLEPGPTSPAKARRFKRAAAQGPQGEGNGE